MVDNNFQPAVKSLIQVSCTMPSHPPNMMIQSHWINAPVVGSQLVCRVNFVQWLLYSSTHGYVWAMFVSWKVVFWKPFSKLSCVCLLLGKLVNGKHFSVKEKFSLVFRKVFSWKIWAENASPEVVKNLEISLYTDYIKFDPQIFYCYIYIFCFEYLFFNFIS